ncbi:MAG: Cocaine esterase [Chlamydiae bacterium]|nr:Cocaine esterase [Chlamydiota bacterium]
MQKILKELSLLRKFFLITLLLFPALLLANTGLDVAKVQIPMRDGLELTTDIYTTQNSKGPQPCILIRGPYERGKLKEAYAKLAHLGYAVAIQRFRSATHAEEFPEPFRQDAWGVLQDGYDTVEWLAQSSYTNGNIGTLGASAMGIAQLLTAPSKPPHLKCQFIQVATPSLYHHAAYIGGKFCKHQIETWFAKAAPLAYQHIIQHNEYDAYWEQIDATKRVGDVCVPALHYGGWYDIFSQGTIDSFTSLQMHGGEGARNRQRLIMGPWTHWGFKPEKFGDFPIPENSMSFNESKTIKSWFDFHLKGDSKALDSEDPVLYYTMGPLDASESSGNKWKTAKNWPPPHKNQPYYFSKKHLLVNNAPLFQKSSYSIDYQPENPVPTIGGRNLYLASGPFDQSPNENRDDVLVFSTPPLKEDSEFTGRIKAKLYISSSAPSADFAITLTDVYPDGKSVLILEGIQSVTCEPNQILPIEIDLWSTSMVFAKGHKIRVNITNSNYPHFDKNKQPSHNVIYVGNKYPSHILLPKALL